MSLPTEVVLRSINLLFWWPWVKRFWQARVEWFWWAKNPSPQAPSPICYPSPITAEFVLDLCMCAEFVFVFVLGLCHGCGLWIYGFHGCRSVDCGLWVNDGGLLIRGLLGVLV